MKDKNFDVFSFDDYRDYLKREFAGSGQGRGRRIILAKALKCQSSFISQVLTKRANLSLEHALQTSEFLRHNLKEKNYFILLVQKEKAGSKALEIYFKDQIIKCLSQREKIQDRIEVKAELNLADQLKYYSKWYYSALHVLAGIPNYNSIEKMKECLSLNEVVVRQGLNFLEKIGMVRKTGSSYIITEKRIHLPAGSDMLPRHHGNWRIKTLDIVESESQENLHYSSILGISKDDYRYFRERLLSLLQEFEPLIQNSKEEVPVVFLFDLFKLS